MVIPLFRQRLSEWPKEQALDASKDAEGLPRCGQKSLEERGRFEKAERHTEDAKGATRVVTVLRWVALPLAAILGFLAPYVIYELAMYLEVLQPEGYWNSIAKQAAYALGGLLAIGIAYSVSPQKNKVLGTVLASFVVGSALIQSSLGGEVSWWVVVIAACFIPAAIQAARDESKRE